MASEEAMDVARKVLDFIHAQVEHAMPEAFTDNSCVPDVAAIIDEARQSAFDAGLEAGAKIAENIDPSPPWPSEDVSWRSRRRDVAQEIAAAIRSRIGQQER